MSALNFAGNPGKAEVREITNKAEWLAWRRHDYTASRIGVLFECHPYIRSLEAVLAEMRGQSVKGDTVYMRSGRWLQAAFPEALKDERPQWRVRAATTYHRLPELRLACTPDFFAEDPEREDEGEGVVETKVFAQREWERHHGRPPLGYLLQTLCQMIVCNVQWGALVVMIKSAEMPLYVFNVPRHPFAEQKILEAVARFWKRVDAGEFPETMPPEELEKALDDGSHKDLSGDNYLPQALERREELQSIRGETDKEINEINYNIKNRLGTASSAWLPGWYISCKKVHYKEVMRRAYDTYPLHVRRTDEVDNG